MTLDLLAISPHPDDVELACGGTLAGVAAAGGKIGVLHLTRGEAGSRGSTDARRREAECAAKALGATVLEFLDCGDGALRTGEAEEDALIEVLRRLRPEIVLAPTGSDRHPDHGRAHRLVEAACFYAGLVKRGEPERGEPHRPAAVFHYMLHDTFQPRFIVDVTQTWDRKLAALACYETQLYQSALPNAHGQPETKVSSPEYWLAVEGRARHFGLLIGAEFGEPFTSRLPIAVSDLMALAPGGLR
ncbi:MAG: bacillithiol biosynthesis deacetylase BshB1 [Thermoanaerobaculia bacterium]